MAEFKAVHVMQLPNSASDDASRALWKAEILRLQKAVEDRFGTPITEAALREAIILKNRERRALANFYRVGQLNPPALSGSDILKVVYGATFRFDKAALIDGSQRHGGSGAPAVARGQTAGGAAAYSDHRLPDRRRGGKSGEGH